MVQSVELLLDAQLDTAIRREWRRLSDAALPSQDVVRRSTNRPHVTLAVARHIDPETDLLLQQQLTAPDLRVTIGGLVIFGGHRKTLAYLVIPTAGLLALQRSIFRVLHACPGIPAHCHPGDWTPHITLARRVFPDEIGPAVNLLTPGHGSGKGAGIRRWDGEERREWRIA
ncbi:2'-5' RNA ligase family protein [Rhodococcus sp. NPDC058505]|uniref:2'-5' RNA ligase family protein n=1 Tax=unclassified Rhodococcus (in: high G+C Gram-positive bacteria) TaxID=192944 RepID=UPI003662BFFA